MTPAARLIWEMHCFEICMMAFDIRLAARHTPGTTNIPDDCKVMVMDIVGVVATASDIDASIARLDVHNLT